MHSLARNHALVDENKRLALGALVAFYGVNGCRLPASESGSCEVIHLGGEAIAPVIAQLRSAPRPSAQAYS